MRRFLLVLFLVICCISTVHGKNKAPAESGSAPKKVHGKNKAPAVSGTGLDLTLRLGVGSVPQKIQYKGKEKRVEYTDYNPATALALGKPKPGEAPIPPVVGARYAEPSTTGRPGKRAKGTTDVLVFDGVKGSLTKKPKVHKTEAELEAKRVICRRYRKKLKADPERDAAARQRRKEAAERKKEQRSAEHKEFMEQQAMQGELPEGQERKMSSLEAYNESRRQISKRYRDGLKQKADRYAEICQKARERAARRHDRLKTEKTAQVLLDLKGKMPEDDDDDDDDDD